VDEQVVPLRGEFAAATTPFAGGSALEEGAPK
jgi:hypothetical protein